MTPEIKPTDGLTPEQDQELAELLSLFRGGRISPTVFTELARMLPMPIVEVVLLREGKNGVEALLIPRPDDDIVWHGMIHNPGTVLRSTDFLGENPNPIKRAFERIQEEELDARFTRPPLSAGLMHLVNERGAGVSQIYIAEIGKEDAAKHRWYPVDGLEENSKFIKSQLPHIKLASKFYIKQKYDFLGV